MYVKPCISAFACALTVGLATAGYAQKNDTVPVMGSMGVPTQIRLVNPNLARPVFTTPSQAFHTRMTTPAKGIHRLGSNIPRPKAGTTTALYQNFPTVIDSHDTAGLYFRLTPPAAPMTVSALLDDFNLPAGVPGATGATVSDVNFVVRNFGTVTQDVYGEVTFYDKIVYTLTSDPANHLVTYNPLGAGAYSFHIVGEVPGIRNFYDLVLPTTGTPVVLTHDEGNSTNQYGFEVRFFDDAAHKVPSPFITAQFPLGTAANPGVQIGESNDSIWLDESNTGAFTGGYTYFTGNFPHLANLILKINGSAPNPTTYSINGTLTFPTVTVTSPTTPINVVWQIHPHTAGASDIYIAGSVSNFTAAIDPNSGAQMGEMTPYELIGFPPDTYDVDIIPEGFADQSVTVSTLSSATNMNQNIFHADATFNTPAGDVTGSIALDGVNDLSATNPAAPLGLFTLSFRTPGTTTELFHRFTPLTTAAMSPNGTFSVFGVPDGTYDVRIKGNKNLAALDAGVVVSSGGAAPAVTLPSGDTNNDNKVDPTDFGIFVSAYNSLASVPGSGYDPTADFNFDGAVDPTDFGLFVGNYNSVGAP